MKSKFLSVGLIAALMVPSMASARTSQAELRGDRQDIRHEQRDVRQAKQEYRSDRRDFRADRHYVAPRTTLRYKRFEVGGRLPSAYYAPAYRVSWNSHWRVPQARHGFSYVRNHNDLLLINVHSGVVVRAYQNFYW